ncbi:GFA family protein [Altererythrobacter sp. ZODW24]|uniref:GFA family protein n=1 Tax=Altererythrobacter sp. ZODW24 TaxID=2185142 RepID=UPI000DF7D149|nr:GFA family protein [Altererythrobacter sp. ZODW24]
MTTKNKGGCLCGAIRYSFTGAPVMEAVCHCTHCQKQSGTAFSALIGVAESNLTVEGTPKNYADKGESGGSVTRQFCANCGSPLFSLVESAPGMVFVKAGTLDDPSGFAPSIHFWGKSKQLWVELGDVPVVEANPG